MALRGVRSSWLMVERNWSLNRVARSASSLERTRISCACLRSVMSSATTTATVRWPTSATWEVTLTGITRPSLQQCLRSLD